MKKIQLLMLLMLPCFLLFGQNVINVKTIGQNSGNFAGLTSNFCTFGRGGSAIGDLDKDGVTDYAIHAFDNNKLEGNFFILFMNKDGSVKNYVLHGPNQGGFNRNNFGNMNLFAIGISFLGDLNNDGNIELAISNASGGINNSGELYIMSFDNAGNLKNWSVIDNSKLPLSSSFYFGYVTALGDLNNDGVKEIAAASSGPALEGSIFILFLNESLNIKKYNIISKNTGNFNGNVQLGFGNSISSIGDLNNDNISDLAVSSLEGTNNNYKGVIWILFLDTSGTVFSYRKIAENIGGYNFPISVTESFASVLFGLGDLDGDSIPDLAVGSLTDSSNNKKTGSVKILYLNNNGTVKSMVKYCDTTSGINGMLSDGGYFGHILACQDLNGDFKKDIIIGSWQNCSLNKGIVYQIYLDGVVHPAPPKALWRVNAVSGNQNTVFNFTQYSTGFPSAYKWSITPNTFTYQSGTSDTSANPIIKFNETANYSVQLKVINPFSSDSLLRSSYISVQKVGINNLTNNNTAISIYPNPTNGLVQIQSSVNIQTILVFDITGKQLLQQEPNAQTDEINISNLPQGLYQIHVQTAMGVLVKKLVKE